MQAYCSAEASPVAVCTLWEGDYHKGLGVLVNSLVAVGFRGRVYAGYRGALPPWAHGGTVDGALRTITPAQDVELIFVKLDTKEHLSHYKPVFCKRVLEELDPSASGLYYLDPDIVVLARWSFFEEWLGFGIASCEDSHLPLNPTHPIARKWQIFAGELGLATHTPPMSCQNSGLVGLQREYIPFLDEWAHIIQQAHQRFALAKDLKSGTRADIFHNVDQDAFNIALSTTVCPASRMGVDAMAFYRGEWLTVHATGKKPWRRKPLVDLLKQGDVPDRALRLYWEYAARPIAVETSSRIQRHRWLIPMAALLSRFYRRG